MAFSPATRVRPYICNPTETLSLTREDDDGLRGHGNRSTVSASLPSLVLGTVTDRIIETEKEQQDKNSRR